MTSHLLSPWSLLLALSFSPLAGQQHQGRWPQQQTRQSQRYPWPGRGETPQTHRRGATISNTKLNKTKSNTGVVATSLPLRLQTATPVLLPLLPLCKHRQQQWQHRVSGGRSSSSRAIVAVAHYFGLPCSINLAMPCSASGIKFPSFILDT